MPTKVPSCAECAAGKRDSRRSFSPQPRTGSRPARQPFQPPRPRFRRPSNQFPQSGQPWTTGKSYCRTSRPACACSQYTLRPAALKTSRDDPPHSSNGNVSARRLFHRSLLKGEGPTASTSPSYLFPATSTFRPAQERVLYYGTGLQYVRERARSTEGLWLCRSFSSLTEWPFQAPADSRFIARKLLSDLREKPTGPASPPGVAEVRALTDVVDTALRANPHSSLSHRPVVQRASFGVSHPRGDQPSSYASPSTTKSSRKGFGQVSGVRHRVWISELESSQTLYPAPAALILRTKRRAPLDKARPSGITPRRRRNGPDERSPGLRRRFLVALGAVPGSAPPLPRPGPRNYARRRPGPVPRPPAWDAGFPMQGLGTSTTPLNL